MEADAHTTITYASFRLTLQEGVRIDPSDINGVVSEAFLQGEGTVQFTLQFESAVSTFSNTVGYYEVAANGALGNVFVLLPIC